MYVCIKKKFCNILFPKEDKPIQRKKFKTVHIKSNKVCDNTVIENIKKQFPKPVENIKYEKII